MVGRLSGGQRSRASLAVALLGSPTCWCSTSRPSASTRCCARDLWALFHRLADAGTAVFVSSHVMDEAERCDRLLLMREGRIIADGTPAEIKEQAGADDIEAAFLAIVEDGRGMSPRITLAVAGRVLTQLRRDHRTLAMLLVLPCLLITLLWWMFEDTPRRSTRSGRRCWRCSRSS